MKYSGVKFIFCNKKNITIGKKVLINYGTKIYSNNYILGNTFVGKFCTIMPYNFIENCTIKNYVEIASSIVKNSIINNGCKIGVYSHLRTQVTLGENCKIGNFCELKNCTLGSGVKVAHLAYLGDCQIGNNCNIGCGVIFANYDGEKKQKIIIGDNVFIGSNSVLIAPLIIADGTYICANTTVTRDTEKNDFIIGRVRAEHKANKGKGRYKNGA